MFAESLLEFEESLSTMATPSTLLMSNLDLKVDLNRFSASSDCEPVTEETLLARFASHDYANDVTSTCTTCGCATSTSAAACCARYVESQRLGFASSLEKEYWVAFFANPYKTIVALPNYTRMVFFQTGVPFQLRGLVWQKLILVNQVNHTGVPEELMMLFRNFQHLYNRDVAKQINKDLTRTFPHIAFFQQPDTVDALLTVLNVYANYDLELGYCQGLLFLVGTLYYHFRHRELTFHTLCKIMDCEPELRSIFVPTTMSATLDRWNRQFLAIFARLDPQLAAHLTLFCDCSVFLYQWFLLSTLIHSPAFLVNNRIVDFCLMEGWKVGIFKVSAGLLLRNKPILMSFGPGDEEVVYQHLLNDLKWGSVINDVTAFFGDLLVSWDDRLFADMDAALVVPKTKAHKRSGSFMVDMLKTLSISHPPASAGSSSESLPKLANRSQVSVFSSTKADSESICSDLTSLSSDARLATRKNSDPFHAMDAVLLENQMLKFLLAKAYDKLTDELLRTAISEALDMAQT